MIRQNISACRLDNTNLIKYGAQRDREIVKAIEDHDALDREQIQALFFNGIKSGERKAQERLAVLVEQKRIQSKRISSDTPAIFYASKFPQRIEHVLGTNWVYVWFKNRLLSGQSIYYWQREVDYKILQADALIGKKIPGETLWYFIEYDRSVNHSKFDKVPKYNEFYEKHESMNLWWAEKAKRFPKILIVTDRSDKKELIQEKIRKDNVNGLKFEVKLLNDIKRGATENGWNK